MAAEENGHRDADRQSDLAVMDANEYKQKRRLQRILDAHDKVEDKANEAWDLFVAGEINHDAKNIMIQRAVKEAVREAYKLLWDHQQSLEDDEYSEYWMGRQNDPIGVIDQEVGDDIYIAGLRHFLNTKEFYQETVERPVQERNKPPEVEVENVKRSVPEHVSWRAYLRLKEFLDEEHDLEITFEEMKDQLPVWGFEEVEGEPDEVVGNGS